MSQYQLVPAFLRDLANPLKKNHIRGQIDELLVEINRLMFKNINRMEHHWVFPVCDL